MKYIFPRFLWLTSKTVCNIIVEKLTRTLYRSVKLFLYLSFSTKDNDTISFQREIIIDEFNNKNLIGDYFVELSSMIENCLKSKLSDRKLSQSAPLNSLCQYLYDLIRSSSMIIWTNLFELQFVTSDWHPVGPWNPTHLTRIWSRKIPRTRRFTPVTLLDLDHPSNTWIGINVCNLYWRIL